MHQLYNQVEREEAKYYDTITETHNSQQSMLSVKGYCFHFCPDYCIKIVWFH